MSFSPVTGALHVLYCARRGPLWRGFVNACCPVIVASDQSMVFGRAHSPQMGNFVSNAFLVRYSWQETTCCDWMSTRIVRGNIGRYSISTYELGVDCADSVCPKTMHGKEIWELFLLEHLAVGYILSEKRTSRPYMDPSCSFLCSARDPTNLDVFLNRHLCSVHATKAVNNILQ